MSALSNESFSQFMWVEAALPFSAIAQRFRIGGILSMKKMNIKTLLLCSGIVYLLVLCFIGSKKNYAAAPSSISPEILAAQQAELLLADMTLHEKICQMMFTAPEQICGSSPITKADEAVAKALTDYPVGGLLYSSPNLISQAQTASMIQETQAMSKIPLFIAADEEGGTVNRLMKKLGTTYIHSMYQYKDEGTDTAYQNACTIASDMSALGFNLDFAPVADVWSNPQNKVIGKRAYSDDYTQASELVSAAVSGFHDGGVLCTLKHFPGHGDTVEDSHKASAHVYKTKEELYAKELQPFLAGITANADFVMMGHLNVDCLDSQNPASLSPIIIQETLRHDLGFDGIVITDALQMSAIANNYTPEEVAIKAVIAGNDMLLEPVDIAKTVSALENAVSQGTIPEERINESVRKILIQKITWMGK